MTTLTPTTATGFDIFQSLDRFMGMAPEDFSPQSKRDLEALFSYCVEGMDDDSEKFLGAQLIKALTHKIQSEAITENIYLKQYEIPQIQLFDILIHKFPFVKFSQQITNEAIVDSIRHDEEIALIDIGIGIGTQVVNIIERSRGLQNLKRMVVVGIEPAADALERAAATILAYNGNVPFTIEFIAIHDFAENVDFSAIGNLPEKIVVNASLALHHIQSQTQRSATIARIKALNPAAFLLIEPNVNHYEPALRQRFRNAYNHFYSIFQVIDRIDDIEQIEKNALKQFFSREIEDIIGKQDTDRYEKHEPAAHWIQRLHDNDFKLNNEFPTLPNDPGAGVKINYHKEGFLGFTFDQETVLAVMFAN